MKKKVAKSKSMKQVARSGYDDMLSGVVDLLEAARRTAARSVNALMTATYWEIGLRIVEHEQRGKSRAGYGLDLLRLLSEDLTARFGRGFSRHNLARFREFYLVFPPNSIRATASLKSAAGRISNGPNFTPGC